MNCLYKNRWKFQTTNSEFVFFCSIKLQLKMVVDYKVNKWRGREGSWWQVGYHVQWPLKPERTTVLSGQVLKFRS